MNIYVIPDTQVKPDIETYYLGVIAYHISLLKPKYIIMLGDWFDMRSLSSYDKGKKSTENQHYLEDIESGNKAMDRFFNCLDKFWPTRKKKTTTVFIKGNHEHRIARAWEYGDANMRYLIENFKPNYDDWDIVVPFLDSFKLENVHFSHYFPNDNSGRPITSARAILNKRHASCIAGHQQGFDYHEQITADKKVIHGIIAGSCYLHDEEYKSPQGNCHFRGTLLLRDVSDGEFDVNRFGLQNLMSKYWKKYLKAYENSNKEN